MSQNKIRIIDKRSGVELLRLEELVVAKNYRTNFSITDIKALADSIKTVGQIQHVIVNRRPDGKYELVAGQRRYYAITLLNLEKIKCVVYNNLTLEEISKVQLSENIKQPIGPVGRAESIPRAKKLVERLRGRLITRNEFASMIKIPPTTVREAYYYNNLEPRIKEAVGKGEISYSIGVQIGRLDKEEQEKVLGKVRAGHLKSAKQVGRFVTDLKERRGVSETLELILQEEDKEGYLRDKVKDYSSSLREAASYLRSLFILLGEKKEAKEVISKAKLHTWVLDELVESVSRHMDTFEERLKAYNKEGLENALHPEKKGHILDIILRERKINSKGETATDLIKIAKEKNVLINRVYRDKNQPRRTNTIEYREYIEVLANNIRQLGILSPVLLVPRKTGGKYYRLVEGETRWRASTKAGLKRIPAIIADLDDVSCYIIQLAADLHRKDSPVERAQALSQLREEKKKLKRYSKREFAKEIEAFIGMKPVEVRKYMRFLDLDKGTKQLVYNKTISFTAALELSRVKDTKQRRDLCKIIVAENLPSQSVKRLVSNTLQTNQWYKGVQGKEKDFLEACEVAGREMAERNIVYKTIISLIRLHYLLENLPREEKFYREANLVRSYAFFKHTLKGYKEVIKK